jgi:transcriptional regulator GlxA family with amidase domain
VPLLNADTALADMPLPQIILIPGCPDPSLVIADDETIAWVEKAHETSIWTTSVCTGALILGAAGILKGLKATTHWLAHEALKDFGAMPTHQRVVREGKIFTSAGVSAGIDMALSLAAAEFDEETAQEIQLIMEYDPEPPFNAGSPEKAPAAIVDKLRAHFP